MSESASPELQAVAALEDVIKHVSEELASWRRRALKAEGNRSGLGADMDVVSLKERVRSLEGQNTELEKRLDVARGRVQDLMKRLQFLEEQASVAQAAAR